jgi:hypothetical protein
MADFGRAVRESGLSSDEAAQALAAAMSERGMSAGEAIEALRRGELRPWIRAIAGNSASESAFWRRTPAAAASLRPAA